MGTTPDSVHTNRDHWTTVVLREREDGTWIATQKGVQIEGIGETAAAAAADYCRKVDESDA